MAFSAPIVEIRTTGNDANGGGFDTGATGFPTDGAATSATGSAPVFTSASYNFVAGDVGAWIFIKSGTNWTPGWYKIASVAANAATLDANTGHVPLYNANTDPGKIIGLSTVAGCATVASPTSATWGIDYSQQDSPQITFADLVIDGTTNTKFTSAAFPVGKNFIGNVINVTSGSGFTVQRVYVLSTSGTVATCDKSLGTLGSTGGAGKMGGALLSPGLAGVINVANGAAWVQSGAYSITSATINVAGGTPQIGSAIRLEGYQTYRTDMGTAPVLTASGISTATIIDLRTTTSHFFRNFTVDGASLTAIKGISSAAMWNEKILAKNCTNNGFLISVNEGRAFNCAVTGCSTQPAWADNGVSTKFINCLAYGNSVAGFTGSNQGTYIGCIAYANSGASSDGFQDPAADSTYINCVSYGNGRHGFFVSVSGGSENYLNCVAEGNAGWGFSQNTGTSADRATYQYCATYNNTSGGIDTAVGANVKEHNITGSASFFTNAAAGDFSPASTSPLKAAGFPGAFLNGLSTGYMDIGAVPSGAGHAVRGGNSSFQG
jgi:hypothetical protein